MPLNFVKFFTPSYFLDLRPVIDPGTLKFLMIGFGIMAVAGVVLKIIVQVKNRSKTFTESGTCLHGSVRARSGTGSEVFLL